MLRLAAIICSLLIAGAASAGRVGHGSSELPIIPTTDFTAADYEYDSSPGTPYTPGTNTSYSSGQEQGSFRFLCNHDHLNYDDPILAPGVQGGSSHLHEFAGNFGTNYASTYASLRASGNGGSCAGGPLNRTGYWAPAVIDTINNKVDPFDTVQFYYKNDRYHFLDIANPGTPPGFSAWVGIAVRQLPRGLRYIFGYNIANDVNNSNFTWSCSDVSEGSHSNLSIAPNHDDPWNFGDLYARLSALGIQSDGVHCLQIVSRGDAPNCWNGHLDSADHFSHVASLVSAGSGTVVCPSSNPYPLPFFTAIFTYQRGTADFSQWYLSSDRAVGHSVKPNGSTFHTDWFGAWDYNVMDYWQTHSIQIQSTILQPNQSPSGNDAQNNSGGPMGNIGLLTTGGSTGGGGTIIAGGLATFPDNELQIPSRTPVSLGCAQADNYVARTSLSGTDATDFANLICGMVTDGLIDGSLLRQFGCGTKFDVIAILAAPDQVTANLNLCGTYYTSVPVGSPAWSANNGYTGVNASTTVYLDPGYDAGAPPIPGYQTLKPNSAHFSVWSNTNSNSGNSVIGWSNGGSQHSLIAPRNGSNVGIFRMQEFTPSSTTSGITDSTGFFLVNRSGQTAEQGYHNATQIFTGTVDSGFPLNTGPGKVVVLARWDQPGPGAVGGAAMQIAAYTIGASLSSTDEANLCHRLNVFMTARNGAASVCP
jgi:hypothetical protein